MTSLTSVMRRWAICRAGLTVLATAVLVSSAGCGSQASDQEIAAALGGPAITSAVAPPDAIASQTGTSVASTDTVPGIAAAGNSATTGSATGVAQTSSGTAGAGATETGTAGTATSGGKASRGPTSAGTPTVASKSEIKIGQLGAFSGVIGAVTGPAPKVMAAWVAYTNARGGLNGHPVKLIVADDQADPATALTLAKRLVESDKILAMAGNINIFGFPQLDQYMRTKNVPMLGDGIDPGWFSSPVAFPVVSHTPVQIVKGLKSFVNDGATKIGMLYCLEVAALCNYLHDETMKSEVGQYVVQSYQVSLVAPSYTSQCLRMKQGGIEVMYLLMDTAGAARAAKDCATQGFKPKIMLLGLDATADMPTIPALSSAFVPGATVPTAATGVPGLAKYHEVMKAYAPTVGDSGVGAYAWVAGEMLGLIGKNLPEKPSSADFLAGLWTVKDETLGGLTVPLTYAKGKNAYAKPCVFIWGTANGKWTAPKGGQPVC